MKRKGFTLIELLAVIVILAIIALIATPMILGVIEKAKKGAAENSVLGYVDAVEKQMVSNMMEQTDIEDGVYQISELETKGVKVKGSNPKYGVVTTQKGEVTNGKFCMNGYSIQYEDNKAKIISDVNYCENNFNDFVKLTYEGKTITNELNNNATTTFTVDTSNSGNWSYIGCNNGSRVQYNNGTVTVTDINENTQCNIENKLISLNKITSQKETNVILLNDSQEYEIYLRGNINLDMNGKKVVTSEYATVFQILDQGRLNIFNSSDMESLISGTNGIISYNSLKMENINVIGEYSAVVVSDGKMTGNNLNLQSKTSAVLVGSKNSNVEITNSTIKNTGVSGSAGSAVRNKDSSVIKLVNCYLKSENEAGIQGDAKSINGSISITGDAPIFDGENNYVSGMYVQSSQKEAVINYGAGNIQLTSGLVEALNLNAIWNGRGTVYIDNTTIKGTGICGLGSNSSETRGRIYINSGDFHVTGGSVSIWTNSAAKGDIYICGGNFNNATIDIDNVNNNVNIYYKGSNIKWANGISPIISGSAASKVLMDNTITCK